MSNEAGLKLSVTGLDAVLAAIKSLEKNAKEAQEKLGGVGEALAGVAGGVATFLSGEKLLEFAKAAEASAASIRLMQGALEATGQTEAFGDLTKQAAEMSDTVGKSAASIREVQRTLLELGASAQFVEKVTPGVFDAAAALGKDVSSMATSVARAMNGNFTQLNRMGVHVKTIEELNAQFALWKGRAAEAVTPTERLAESSDKLGLSLGKVINAAGLSELKTKVAEALDELAGRINQWLDSNPEVIEKLKEMAEVAGDFIAKNIGKIAIALGVLGAAATALGGMAALGTFMLLFGPAIAAAVPLVAALGVAVAGFFAGFNKEINGLKASDWIADLGNRLLNLALFFGQKITWAELKESFDVLDKDLDETREKIRLAKEEAAKPVVHNKEGGRSNRPEFPDPVATAENLEPGYRLNELAIQRRLVGITAITEQYKITNAGIKEQLINLQIIQATADETYQTELKKLDAQKEQAEQTLNDKKLVQRYAELREEYDKLEMKHEAELLKTGGQRLKLEHDLVEERKKLFESTYAGSTQAKFDADQDQRKAERQTGNAGIGAGAIAGAQSAYVQLGSTAKQVGTMIENSIGGVVDSLADAFTKLIERTITWKQALVEVGRAILNSVISAFARMAAQMLVSFIMQRIFGEILVKSSVVQAAQLAAAWGPAAAAASTATLGGAAVIGQTSAIGAMVAGASAGAAIAGGMGVAATGGLIHGGEQAIRVNEVGSEYVIQASAVRSLGTDTLDYINKGQLPVVMAMGSSRSTVTPSSAGTGRGGNLNLALFDNRRDYRRWETEMGDARLVDVVRRYRQRIA